MSVSSLGAAFPLALAMAALTLAEIRADPAQDRLVTQIEKLRPDLAGDVRQFKERCAGSGALCLARAIAAHDPETTALVPVSHPQTDTIRWERSQPSVAVSGRTVSIYRFGRSVVRDLRSILDAAGPGPIDLDLRQNQGGDFERMKQVAAILLPLGHYPMTTTTLEGLVSVDVVHGTGRDLRLGDVTIGTKTTSAGEILAALLAEAGARICGDQPTAGSLRKKAVTIADHDWRLVLVLGDILVGRNANGNGKGLGVAPQQLCGRTRSLEAGSN